MAFFYFAGGITGLARDVGDSGAWLVLLIFRLLDATSFSAGLVAVVVICRGRFRFVPNWFSTALAAGVLSVAVTGFGLFSEGPGVSSSVYFAASFGLAFFTHYLLAADGAAEIGADRQHLAGLSDFHRECAGSAFGAER